MLVDDDLLMFYAAVVRQCHDAVDEIARNIDFLLHFVARAKIHHSAGRNRLRIPVSREGLVVLPYHDHVEVR